MPRLAFTLPGGARRPGVCLYKSEDLSQLALGVWLGSWTFLALDTAHISLELYYFFFHLETLSWQTLEILAVCQEFLSTTQMRFACGTTLHLVVLHRWLMALWWGFGLYQPTQLMQREGWGAMCVSRLWRTGESAEEARPALSSETVSGSHFSWDWKSFSPPLSNIQMAVNACIGHIHACCTKKKHLVLLLEKVKWQHQKQSQKSKCLGGNTSSVFPALVLCCKIKATSANSRLPGT